MGENSHNKLNVLISYIITRNDFAQKKSIIFVDRDFIASRRVSLERFLQNIVRHTLLRNALVVRQFLDPHNYTQNFKGIVISALYLNGQDKTGSSRI